VTELERKNLVETDRHIAECKEYIAKQREQVLRPRNSKPCSGNRLGSSAFSATDARPIGVSSASDNTTPNTYMRHSNCAPVLARPHAAF
jgi:hypothetical protein